MAPLPTRAEDLSTFDALFGIKGKKRKRTPHASAPSAPAPAQQAAQLDADPDILELKGLLEQRSLVSAAAPADAPRDTQQQLLHPQLRERAARNRQAALTQRQALVERGLAQELKDRTARNKEAALAKRAARAKPTPAKPGWNITVATSSHFGTDGSTSGAQATLTSSQRARVACSIASAAAASPEVRPIEAAAETSRQRPEVLSNAPHEQHADRIPTDDQAEATVCASQASASSLDTEQQLTQSDLPSTVSNEPCVETPPDPSSQAAAFLRNPDEEVERRESPAPLVEPPLLDTTGHDLETLQDLVELTEVGARVVWPDGLNLLTARLLLSSARRAARQQSGGSTVAEAPVLTAGTSDLPQSVEPWTTANRIAPSDAPT